VRNQTGYSSGEQERYADAVAVNLWPSRGLEVVGFEIKARRGDWTKELKNPSKSAAIQKYCDRWWVVAGGRNIVQPGELPPTWGLLVVHGGNSKRRIVCTNEAPKLEPQALDKPFLLAMLRRAAELEDKLKEGSGDENFQRGWQEGLKRGEQNQHWAKDDLERKLKYLKESIAKFEKVAGVRLSEHRSWQWGDIGMAVRVVLKNIHQPNGHREALREAMVPLQACLSAMQAIDQSFTLLEEGTMGRKG
jgi:hypothetical protein